MSIERPATSPDRSPIPDQSGEPRVDRPSGPTERSSIEAKLDALERRALSDDRPQPAERRTAAEPEKPEKPETRLSPMERKLALLDSAAGGDPVGDASLDAAARKRDGSDRPERLGWRLTRIWRDSRPTADGRAFYEKSDDRMWKAASTAEPAPGRYTADLHGNPTAFRVGSHDLDARQLAALIRKDENWQGRPIRLMSCETGKGEDPVAQKLADALGVTVTAPTELAVSDKHGNVYTTSVRIDRFGFPRPAVPHDGVWLDFQPRTEGGKDAPDPG